MKILALIGSPRKQGNTDIMADEVLRGAKESEIETGKIYLDDFWIRPVSEVCDKTWERDDPRKDDDFPKILAEFLDSDIVIFSSPVYWHGISAQLKCFNDRLSSYFRRPPYAKRFNGKGYIVLCAYGRSEPVHGQLVTDSMKLTVESLRGYYLGDVCADLTYEKGIVRHKPDIMKSCYELGKKAGSLLKKCREEVKMDVTV